MLNKFLILSCFIKLCSAGDRLPSERKIFVPVTDKTVSDSLLARDSSTAVDLSNLIEQAYVAGCAQFDLGITPSRGCGIVALETSTGSMFMEMIGDPKLFVPMPNAEDTDATIGTRFYMSKRGIAPKSEPFFEQLQYRLNKAKSKVGSSVAIMDGRTGCTLEPLKDKNLIRVECLSRVTTSDLEKRRQSLSAMILGASLSQSGIKTPTPNILSRTVKNATSSNSSIKATATATVARLSGEKN